MFTPFMKQLRTALLMLFWLSVLTGLAYPLAMTGLGKALFPVQAGGSLIVKNDIVAGSSLIGQPFTSERYFHGRPSATSPYEYNASSSAGSNLGPSNPALAEAVGERARSFVKENGGGPAPMDIVTASGSGLDPHISPDAAARQMARVAKARSISPKLVAMLIDEHTEGRLFGFWGEPRVNVLELNLALDAAEKKE